MEVVNRQLIGTTLTSAELNPSTIIRRTIPTGSVRINKIKTQQPCKHPPFSGGLGGGPWGLGEGGLDLDGGSVV